MTRKTGRGRQTLTERGRERGRSEKKTRKPDCLQSHRQRFELHTLVPDEIFPIPDSALQLECQMALVHSWCDGSSDRSFMVDPLNYFSFSVQTSDFNPCWAISHSRQCSTTGVPSDWSTHGAMGHRINPSWWTHWTISHLVCKLQTLVPRWDISHSRQCSTIGVPNGCGPLMVRWVIGSILHGGPIELFLIPATVLHNWCNKVCGMCYPVCGMVHIKEPLLLIESCRIYVMALGFFSHYVNISLPYVWCHTIINKVFWVHP